MNKDNYCRNISEVKKEITDIIITSNANNQQIKNVLEVLDENTQNLNKNVNTLIFICFMLFLNIIILYGKIL